MKLAVFVCAAALATIAILAAALLRELERLTAPENA